MSMIYPNPEWTADDFACEHGHVTQRFSGTPEGKELWPGVVICRECRSPNTRLVARNVPARPIKEAPIVAIKPDRAPLTVLRSTADGPHLPHPSLHRSTYEGLFEKISA